jgi:hypothetical protein
VACGSVNGIEWTLSGRSACVALVGIFLSAFLFVLFLVLFGFLRILVLESPSWSLYKRKFKHCTACDIIRLAVDLGTCDDPLDCLGVKRDPTGSRMTVSAVGDRARGDILGPDQ